MEEYLLQGPPAYKRARLPEPPPALASSGNFLDARSNMVPFGFISSQDRDGDMNLSTLSMGGNLALNQVHLQEFGSLPGSLDWRHTITPYTRHRFFYKISQALFHQARNNSESADNQLPKCIAAARKIEGKAFKMAASRSQYFVLVKEEIHKIQSGYGFPGMSSQFLPSSSTTSASVANNMQLVNMQQNYGPNNFGEQVTATQSHSQSMTPVNLFSDESSGTGGSMRIPVTSSIGSSRPNHFDAYNGRRTGGSIVHDIVSGTNIPIVPRSPRVHHHHHHNHHHYHLQQPPPPIPPPLSPSSKQQRTSATTNAARAFPGGGGGGGGGGGSGNGNGNGNGNGGNGEQFLSTNSTDQVLPGSLIHSMAPLNHFVAQANAAQQRFGCISDQNNGVLSENSSIVNAQQMLGNRLQSKEWHKSVTFNIRNRLIRKMAQILSTTPDPQASSIEGRMHNCISIATNVENETYRTANSMTQYYDLMAKRCHFIAKERANPNQPNIQYYNLSDIRRTYEALGIAYPMGPSFPNNSSNGARLHGSEVPPPPPPPGVVPTVMGPSGPLPYCTFGRAQALQQAGHNQLLDRFLQGAVPLTVDSGGHVTEVPEVIKQLAHAYKCQERENQENEVMMLCSLPHCRETKSLLYHIANCQAGVTCCGSTKEIIDHWNRCSLVECPICMPVRQAERNLNSNVELTKTTATTTSLSSQMSPTSFMHRPHRNQMNSSYPSTATSGLLTNQPPTSQSNRNERISPRSSMWHSSYSDNPSSWRSSSNNQDDGLGRRSQPRFWLHSRNRHERRAPYSSPWTAPDIIFVDHSRNNSQPQSRSSLFGNAGSSRNTDRLQPYGTPWRSPRDILFVENVRPAHRQAQDSLFLMNMLNDYLADTDEPVIIPPEEEATPTEQQQIMAIVKVVQTSGCRLEQKYRCARRSCTFSWPCLHRRLAASIKSLQTPIPG